jgi:LmbE family N-acetylglucosaminyl deacetylase
MPFPRPVDRWLTRRRRAVPDGAWPALRAAASLAGDGPLVGLPSLRRVLVLAPHPDDETIGAGGTLARLAAAGATVEVVVLTDGEATPGTGLEVAEAGRRRRQEAARACVHLGLAPPKFGGHPDGGLAQRQAELAGELGALVPDLAPQAVFLPWFGDGHPDHRAVSAALARTGLPDRVDVWAYETWAPLPANRVVDITPVVDLKRRALAAHVTAGAAFDLDAMIGLNRYRSVHGLAGRGWAEAFLVAPAPRYLALAGAGA